VALEPTTSFAPSVAVLLAAVALDAVVGEPPNAVHPVAWMGGVAAPFARRALRLGPHGQLLAGGVLALVLPAVFALVSAILLRTARVWTPLAVLAAIALLKPTFALRALGLAAQRVRDSLAAGELEQARRDLGCLCSRDASTLDPSLVIASTVESLAENASDSFVAPLFYYTLFGLPGAVFYRAVNTLDAMIGYRGRYEHLGKAAARLDDVLNFVPARLTALALLLVAPAFGASSRRGWRVVRRDGGRTESPNAGRPMAAMAGLLGVELEKPGHYRLGDRMHDLSTQTIDAAWRAVIVAACVTAFVFVLLIGARRAWFG
jgi:adenosylcobinamide-phosphate synthase